MQGPRLAAGLSQTQLAEKIGTAQSHIALIEQGKNDPGTDLITRIAEALTLTAETESGPVRGSILRIRSASSMMPEKIRRPTPRLKRKRPSNQ